MIFSKLRGRIDIVALLGALLFLLGAIWFVAIWRWAISSDFIPLHYTVYFGFDRFGPRFDLFLYPVLATAIAGANASILIGFYRRERFVTRYLLVATILLELFLGLGFLLSVLKAIS